LLKTKHVGTFFLGHMFAFCYYINEQANYRYALVVCFLSPRGDDVLSAWQVLDSGAAAALRISRSGTMSSYFLMHLIPKVSK